MRNETDAINKIQITAKTPPIRVIVEQSIYRFKLLFMREVENKLHGIAKQNNKTCTSEEKTWLDINTPQIRTIAGRNRIK